MFSGSATITDGRIRHFSLPNALDAINGTIRFDRGGIRLDEVAATMGGGTVQFGGRIGFDGYVPADLNVTARGEDMHLRVPEGVRSVVDADLSLRGTFKSPTLGGTVTVKSALWNRRVDTPGSIFDLASRRSGRPAACRRRRKRRSTVPLRFDIQLLVPSTLRVENNLARLVASADLTLRGTYDRPVFARPRRHRARRGDLRRAGATGSRTARSTSPTRRGSSRSSTSRPRPTCACRGRPTA